MKGKILYTADLHLTAHPKDEYRWHIFPYLEKTIRQRQIAALVIAGDLTDAKDHHPSKLVNRLTEELAKLGKLVPVYVLMGNHDYVDPRTPFFGFLDSIPGVRFINEISDIMVAGHFIRFLPHISSWKVWRKMLKWKGVKFDRVVIHQAVAGAKGSNGMSVDGMPLQYLQRKYKKQIVAGDIHLPQTLGNVLYCGSPHPVHFGEEHKPRVLIDNGEGKLFSLNRASIRKRVLKISDPALLLEMQYIDEGDMVKVVYQLPRSEFHRWQAIRDLTKKACAKRKLVLCGVEIREKVQKLKAGKAPQAIASVGPMKVYDLFCEAHGINGKAMEAGRAFLNP
jgi:calcineurin-like phosphoesterase family protein